MTNQTKDIINKPLDIFLQGKERAFLEGKGLWKESYTELILSPQ